MKLRSKHLVFDWDPAKAAFNHRKHGVSFWEAATIFETDPVLTRYDSEHSSGEDRRITVGHSLKGATLVVVHTLDEEIGGDTRIRIVSARNATSRERMLYECGADLVQEEIAMQDEYDFSNAVRRAFNEEGAVFHIPVYLDRDVLDYFMEQARKRDMEPDALINELLKQDMERLKAGE